MSTHHVKVEPLEAIGSAVGSQSLSASLTQSQKIRRFAIVFPAVNPIFLIAKMSTHHFSESPIKTDVGTGVRQSWESRALFVLTLVFLFLFPVALIHSTISTDDAWLGEQVYQFSQNGQVSSNLFRDFPPLDQKIVVYHKLLIWVAAALTKVIGWGLLQLRLVAALAGIATALAILFFKFDGDSRRVRVFAAFTTLMTPLFWHHMMIFRPETLATLCGFISFGLLCFARKKNNLPTAILSGVFAGLAGLTHGLFISFAFAGFVSLLIEKRFRFAVFHIAAALIAYSPYFSALLTDRDLFLAQGFNNNLMLAKFSFDWWQPALNLLAEHKRIFRKPEVIGISLFFTLALLMLNKNEWNRHKFFFCYLAVLMIILGASPLPKVTQYLTPLVPFFALAIARVWGALPENSSSRPRYLKLIFSAWAILFFVYSIGALTREAFFERRPDVATNAMLAAEIRPGAIVMAPFDFIFEEIDKFTIQSWRGAQHAAGKNKSVEFLENYARDWQVDYLIIDSDIMETWNIRAEDFENKFRSYRLHLSLPGQNRYLLIRPANRVIDPGSAL